MPREPALLTSAAMDGGAQAWRARANVRRWGVGNPGERESREPQV